MKKPPLNSDSVHFDKLFHYYAIMVVIVTAILIYAGGLVTTIGAGLAVPDWPLSFGSLNPSGWWNTPMVREEHGHRLIGATVGILTLGMFIWLMMKKSSKWLRNLGIIALIAVITQGILGGLRVLDRNIYFAMLHACLAQGFFCVLVAVAWGSSRQWQSKSKTAGVPHSGDRNLALLVCIFIFMQISVGAVMRHSGAGLAIATFPLVDGKLFPSEWNKLIGLNYLHRLGALLILISVFFLFLKSLRSFPKWPRLMANCMLFLTLVQVVLGAITIWSGRAVLPTTLHVLMGALLLASSVSCALWLFHEENAGLTQNKTKQI